MKLGWVWCTLYTLWQNRQKVHTVHTVIYHYFFIFTGYILDNIQRLHQSGNFFMLLKNARGLSTFANRSSHIPRKTENLTQKEKVKIWFLPGSNRRPHPCEGCVITTTLRNLLCYWNFCARQNKNWACWCRLYVNKCYVGEKKAMWREGKPPWGRGARVGQLALSKVRQGWGFATMDKELMVKSRHSK